MKPTLVILAAGIGSRYGSFKQIDQVGPSGETIIDYSIYDAILAGFGKVVFVIRKDIEAEFKEVFLKKLKDKIQVEYVFQELDQVPQGFQIPAGRIKPWGTSHAVLVTEPKVKEPFAVINADDFYGYQSFETMAEFLKKRDPQGTVYSLIGYVLKKTLSDHGEVARGVCEVGSEGRLAGVVERLHIEKSKQGVIYRDENGSLVPLKGDEIVSMNFWGFTPTFFSFARKEFEAFLRKNLNNPKAELYIPLVVNALVKSGVAQVEVLPSREKWFGMTHKDDKPVVMQRLRSLVSQGIYPARLWG
jgi:dTDP-glucose pyrophosphorylase